MATRMRLAIVAVVVLGAPLLAFAVMSTLRQGEQLPTLSMALAALDEGDYPEARRIAELLRDIGGLSNEEASGPAYILGVVNHHEAAELVGRGSTDFYALAARYLEHAFDLGFPAGREATGSLLLGESLFRSGQLAASQPYLATALAANPQRSKELRAMLAEACLDERKPDPSAALEHITAYLADTTLTEEERAAGALAQARILLQLGKHAECRAALEPVANQVRQRGEATILRARLEMDAARRLAVEPAGDDDAARQARIRQHYEAALAQLKTVHSADTLENKVSGRASYLLGLCLMALGEDRAALEQFAETRTLYHGQPEGFAASLEEADLLRKLDRAEAAAAYERVLVLAGDPAEFRNPWISLDEVRRRVLAAYDAQMAASQFDAALAMADHFEPLFARERSVALVADTHAAWSRTLMDRAAKLSRAEADTVEREGRLHARKAGETYVLLAQLRYISREYPDDLWKAAENFHRGRDYTHAIEFYKQYLVHEARRRRALALVGLAESFLAADEVEAALSTCRECLENYPRDAATFRGRIVASRALVELGQNEEAKKLLRENLEGNELTPASLEWRDSLIELARLLHLEQKYAEALPRLEEAVERYADAPQALELRYLLADSALQLADEVRAKAETTSVATARLALKRQSQQHLRRATEEYDLVQQDILRRQADAEPSTLDVAMLRNCYFARGAALTELEQYEQAIEVYNSATNRYQKSPVVMEAYVGTANCYRQLGQIDEARGIISQAKVVLARVKQESTVPFEDVTNYSSQQWEELLDWLLDLYGNTS